MYALNQFMNKSSNSNETFVLLGLVQILQVFRSFDYLGFLFCSSLALLLASFTIHRGKTTVTPGMQLGLNLTEEESSLVEAWCRRS